MRLLRLLLIVAALLQAGPALNAQDTPRQQEPVVSSYHLDPPLLARAEAIHRIRVIRLFAYPLYSFILLIVALRIRLAVRYREFASRPTRNRALQALIFTPLLMLTFALLILPLDAHGHSTSVRYGLSVQSWGSWFVDWVKVQVLYLVIASLLVCGFYELVRRSPRRWWFYGWLFAMPIMIFFVFVAPLVIDPMFNHYDSLSKTRPALAREVQRVAQRGGLSIPDSRIFEMRASEKVTTYNAYVTGLGASKRIVVWDTTARDLTTAETLAVFGHEMGHYVLHHIWQGLAVTSVGLFIGFWMVFHLYGWSLKRWGTALSITGPTDLASLPLLLLLALLLSFFSSPIENAFSRRIEHQADVYGLEVTHSIVPEANEAAAASFQRGGERGLAVPDPNPFLVFWAFSHPPVAERVRLANEYRPWDHGQPGRFIH